MKTKIFLLFLALGLIVSAFSQKPTIELTFTAENNGQYVPLDSILIENLTQGGDTIIYPPDTVLVLDYVTGTENKFINSENTFSVSHNYPNPFSGKTRININMPQKKSITITIRDMVGRELVRWQKSLNKGRYIFEFKAGSQSFYFLTVCDMKNSKTNKMLQLPVSHRLREQCQLKYIKSGYCDWELKNGTKLTGFSFNDGDTLLMIGYSGDDQPVFIDSPNATKTYHFQFATNVPCPGIPTVDYMGQVYNTIQVYNQCWMKENLNVGLFIDSHNDQQDNGIIEKYCYDNVITNCEYYGGLYQWNEMMQYTWDEGTQGICPPGWHIPTDEEWKILEGMVDSQYGYPDPEWDDIYWRGYNAGRKLKSTGGWWANGNGTNSFGVKILPAGQRTNATGYNFEDLNGRARMWTSKRYFNLAWIRYFEYDYHPSSRIANFQVYGCSVRCLKD